MGEGAPKQPRGAHSRWTPVLVVLGTLAALALAVPLFVLIVFVLTYVDSGGLGLGPELALLIGGATAGALIATPAALWQRNPWYIVASAGVCSVLGVALSPLL